MDNSKRLKANLRIQEGISLRYILALIAAIILSTSSAVCQQPSEKQATGFDVMRPVISCSVS